MVVRDHQKHSGFTLVELLVVIAIIGVLMSIALPAINMVRRRALVTRVAAEVTQMASAIEAYRERHGDYPPDFGDKTIVERHIRKVWPRINQAEMATVWPIFWKYPTNDANQESNLDAAEAIVFWLGGFSSDPRRPFTGSDGPLVLISGNVRLSETRNKGVFEFDESRLTMQTAPGGGRISTDGDGDPFPIYMPKRLTKAYVYFDSRTYPAWTANPAAQLRPYLSDRPTTNNPYINRDTFQIISAGLDNSYGSRAANKMYPSGNNYSVGDKDNVTNFSEGRQLKDQQK